MTNEAKPMRLIDAPVGLLECNGTIIMKTEYMTQSDDGSEAPECYIVETGEYFCGGVDTLEELRNMEVKQVCFNNFFEKKMLESENRILSERITETEAKCKRLEESRERANESAHMWESRCKMLEEQTAAPAEVLEAIDGLIEFARERMSITDWLYYVNVIGTWRGGEGGVSMEQHKPCYSLCHRCVWRYNGGCSEWRKYGH